MQQELFLGILVGKLSLNFGDNFSFSLGLTGGVLMVPLILGRTGKTGPIMWTMTGASNQLLRQFGLLLFLAAVGTSAGTSLVDTFQQYGLELFGLWYFDYFNSNDFDNNNSTILF